MSIRERARGIADLGRIALTTRAPVRFLARQATRAPGAHGYRLRHSGFTVWVRHGTADLNTFDEVFLQRQYEPPPGAAAVLRSLQRPLVIADLGANVGLASAYLCSHLPVGRILAFEPDPANAAVLAQLAKSNPHTEIELIEACADRVDGTVPFLGGQFALSHIAENSDPSATPVRAVDALPRLAECDLLKLDIEGGEWNLLSDARFADLSSTAVVLEYHPHLCPVADARAEAIRALSAAGYSVHPVMHKADGAGVLWGWQTRAEGHPSQVGS